MTRFDERLERGLRQIADRATPSPIAWPTIQARIEDQDPAEETEIIMFTETDPRVRRRRPALAAAGVVVVVVALVVGLVLNARHNEPEERAASVSSPANVLDRFVQAFNAHDLDAVMALYADDAVIPGHPLDPNPPAEGVAEIRSVMIDDMGTANTYEMIDVKTAGQAVTFGHIYRLPDGACYSGTDRVVVGQGKIVSWDFITHSQPCQP